MKADELKTHIRLTRREVGHHQVMLLAQLQVQTCRYYDGRYADAAVREQMEEEVKEDLMRYLYADQRERLEQALRRLLCAAPNDLGELAAAREEILTAALRQKPE